MKTAKFFLATCLTLVAVLMIGVGFGLKSLADADSLHRAKTQLLSKIDQQKREYGQMAVHTMMYWGSEYGTEGEGSFLRFRVDYAEQTNKLEPEKMILDSMELISHSYTKPYDKLFATPAEQRLVNNPDFDCGRRLLVLLTKFDVLHQLVIKGDVKITAFEGDLERLCQQADKEIAALRESAKKQD